MFKKFILSFFATILVLTSGVNLAFADPDPATDPTAVGTGTDTPTEGSSSRIKTSLDLAKGKKATDPDLGKMTYEEMRFLGIYLSNYYTPWGTEFGTKSGNKAAEGTTQTKDLVGVLTDVVGFDASTAKTAMDYVETQIVKNSKQLKLGYACYDYKQGPKSIKNLPMIDNQVPWMYWLGLSSGYNITDKVGIPKCDKTGNSVFLYYENEGKKIIVGDANVTHEFDKFTAFQETLYQLLMQIHSPDNGRGATIWDVYADDFKTLEENPSAAYANSLFNSKMMVSPFGDIWVKGPNHNYVAVPGAVNPYTWEFYKGVTLKGSNFDENESTNSSVKTLVNNGENWQSGSNIQKVSLPGYLMEKEVVFRSSDPVSTNTTSNFLRYTGDRYLVDSYRTVFQGPDATFWNSTTSDFQWLRWCVNGNNLSDPDFWRFSDSAVLVNMETNLKIKYDPLLSPYSVKFPTAFGNTAISWGILPFKVGAESVSGKTTAPVNNKIYFLDTLESFNWTGGGVDTDFASKILEVGSNGEISTAWQALLDSSDEVQNNLVNLKSGAVDYSKYVGYIPKSFNASVYLSYVYAAFGEDSEQKALGWRLNPNLPELDDKLMEWGTGNDENAKLNAIIDYLYFLLNPSWENIHYFAQLITSKLAGFLLRWHSDMIGGQASSAITGSTKYVGFTGFTTTPNLTDMSWTAKLVDIYNTYQIYIILFVAIVLACYVILRVVTGKQAVGTILLFTIVIMSVIPMINSTVNITNRVADLVYSKKFTYWALVQQQTYSNAIDEASKGDTYSNYMNSVFSADMKAGNNIGIGLPQDKTDVNTISNRGGDNVLVKWQAPKKVSSYILANSDKDDSFNKMTKLALKNVTSQEYYLKDTDKLYLLRSYNDIGNFGRYVYAGMSDDPTYRRQDWDEDPRMEVTDQFPDDLRKVWATRKDDINQYESKGYTNYNDTGTFEPIRVDAPMGSKIVSDKFYDIKRIEKGLNLDEYVGIPSEALENIALPYFINEQRKNKILEDLQASADSDFDPLLGGYNNGDYAQLVAFELYSESPFFYFDWKLFDDGMKPGIDSQGTFKDLLLKQPNQGYFYNNLSKKGTENNNGELKDFLDLRSLFTYFIPYAHQANNVVVAWDKKYGYTYNEGVPSTIADCKAPEIQQDKELKQKCWHNVNVNRLYNLYTPWVDVMYDTAYAKPTFLDVQGKRILVEDPLNPVSYPANRPMVFSRSEALEYGLTDNKLTEVERRIIKVQEKTQDAYFELMNYYNFNDNVVATGAAMMTTFIFNQVFSEDPLWTLGSPHVLYPQAFELKNFGFDAYLRLILSQSIGENILTDSQHDFYQNVVQKSSLSTAIMLIVTDVVAIYAVPLLKWGILIGIIIATILMVMATALRVTEGKLFTRVREVLLDPLGKFLGITIVLALLVSLMMSNGARGVTGEFQSTISLGDPVIVLLALVILCVVICWAYFKIFRALVKSIIKYGKLTYTATAGAFKGVMGKLAESVGASSLATRIRGTAVVGGAVAGGVALSNSKLGQNVRAVAGKLRRNASKVGRKTASMAKSTANKGMQVVSKETKQVQTINSRISSGSSRISQGSTAPDKGSKLPKPSAPKVQYKPSDTPQPRVVSRTSRSTLGGGYRPSEPPQPPIHKH